MQSVVLAEKCGDMIVKSLPIWFCDEIDNDKFISLMTKRVTQFGNKIVLDDDDSFVMPDKLYRYKYVIYEVTNDDDSIQSFFVVFHPDIIHADMAKVLRYILHDFGYGFVAGAGFLDGCVDNPRCYGISESLGVKSREEFDVKCIRERGNKGIRVDDYVEPELIKPVVHKLNTVAKSTGGIILQGKKGKRWS